MPTDALASLLRDRRVVALTGAGMSTESGIPDYRGPETRRRARSPIQYRAFVNDPAARTRYWARSAIGWQRMADARPNAGHVALARLEAAGVIRGVITQNVDRLHQAAGSRCVVELHGALDVVRCLGCGEPEARRVTQRRIEALNPGWTTRSAPLAPDGDAEVADADTEAEAFRVPGCRFCRGPLKPDVVFFGENVPRPRVEAAFGLLAEADVLLVLGSSLAVYSGYRFVRKAVEAGTPVALVTLGPTRADALATLRLDARLGDILPPLAETLMG